MSTLKGAVPTPLLATMGRSNGAGDKPFTYLPGGMDFSELKSPKMSRRIANNQNGVEQHQSRKACATPLPFGNDHVDEEVEAVKAQSASRGKSLPRAVSQSNDPQFDPSICVPKYGHHFGTPLKKTYKQRSISDMLSMPHEELNKPPVKEMKWQPKPKPREEKPMYNPYANNVTDYSSGIDAPPMKNMKNEDVTDRTKPRQEHLIIKPLVKSQVAPPQPPPLVMPPKPQTIFQDYPGTTPTPPPMPTPEPAVQPTAMPLPPPPPQQLGGANFVPAPPPPPSLPQAPVNNVAKQASTSRIPPPPPPPPPNFELDDFNVHIAAPRSKTGKVGSAHEMLKKEKEQKLLEEKLKREEEERKRREEEERRRREEEERRRREEEERRRREEEERRRKEEEERRRREEEERIRREEEERQRRLEEERMRREEENRLRKEEEEQMRRLEEERQRQERKRIEEQRMKEERRKLEEERRKLEEERILKDMEISNQRQRDHEQRLLDEQRMEEERIKLNRTQDPGESLFVDFDTACDDSEQWSLLRQKQDELKLLLAKEEELRRIKEEKIRLLREQQDQIRMKEQKEQEFKHWLRRQASENEAEVKSPLSPRLPKPPKSFDNGPLSPEPPAKLQGMDKMEHYEEAQEEVELGVTAYRMSPRELNIRATPPKKIRVSAKKDTPKLPSLGEQVKEQEERARKIREEQEKILKEQEAREQKMIEQEILQAQFREQQRREQEQRELLQREQMTKEQQSREQKQREEQQRREQQLREQQLREQQLKEQQLREQQLREQQQREEQQRREQQLREQQLREQQLREQQLREQQLREQKQREEQRQREEQQRLEQQQREEQQRRQQEEEQRRREEQEQRLAAEKRRKEEEQLKQYEFRDQQIRQQQELNQNFKSGIRQVPINLEPPPRPAAPMEIPTIHPMFQGARPTLFAAQPGHELTRSRQVSDSLPDDAFFNRGRGKPSSMQGAGERIIPIQIEGKQLSANLKPDHDRANGAKNEQKPAEVPRVSASPGRNYNPSVTTSRPILDQGEIQMQQQKLRKPSRQNSVVSERSLDGEAEGLAMSLKSARGRRASDTDYMNDTRRSVVHEFEHTNAGRNLRPSRFYGAKKQPSQSPSMRLLGKIHIAEDDDRNQGPADFTEGVSVSKEYNGEQGRYLPPRQGRPVLQQSMSHQ